MMVVHLFSPDKSRDTLFISNYANARDQGRADPRRRRRLDHGVRQPRLCDAGLARSRPAAIARPDRERRRRGAAGAEHPGRLRRPQPAAGRPSPARSRSRCSTLGRLADPERVRQYRRQADRQRRGAAQGRRAGRTGRRWTIRRIPISTAIRRWRSRCSSGRARTRSRPREDITQDDGGDRPSGFRRAEIRHRLQPDRSSSSSRSTPSSRRSSRRSCWSCWWSCCSCRPGAPRSSRSGRHPGVADRHVLPDGAVRLLAQQPVAVRAGARRSASWSTTPSSWSRTSSATSRPGLSPRDAAQRAWTRSARALVAIALVLCAVFMPSAFITGISGQFYRQFALTIAGATVISLVVSLTLSPALCALLLKPHDKQPQGSAGGSGRSTASSALFNCGFDKLSRAAMAGSPARSVRFAVIMLVIYAGIIGLRPQRIPQDAAWLHPAARPRLPDRRRRSCRPALRWRAPTR